jgi:hypothetical protein
MAKYERLHEYLVARQDMPRVRMTFADVAAVIRAELPRSAFEYREWWANQSNTTHRPQAAAWLDAGFVVGGLHQGTSDGWVEFARR